MRKLSEGELMVSASAEQNRNCIRLSVVRWNVFSLRRCPLSCTDQTFGSQVQHTEALRPRARPGPDVVTAKPPTPRALAAPNVQRATKTSEDPTRTCARARHGSLHQSLTASRDDPPYSTPRNTRKTNRASYSRLFARAYARQVRLRADSLGERAIPARTKHSTERSRRGRVPREREERPAASTCSAAGRRRCAWTSYCPRPTSSSAGTSCATPCGGGRDCCSTTRLSTLCSGASSPPSSPSRSRPWCAPSSSAAAAHYEEPSFSSFFLPVVYSTRALIKVMMLAAFIVRLLVLCQDKIMSCRWEWGVMCTSFGEEIVVKHRCIVRIGALDQLLILLCYSTT